MHARALHILCCRTSLICRSKYYDSETTSMAGGIESSYENFMLLS